MAQKPVVLDISHHNEIGSWLAVKAAGVQGIIHKATQGIGLVDSTYGKRRQEAEAAGLLWGAYHFSSNGDGARQADHFLDVAKPGPSTLLALDWEDDPTDKAMTMTAATARAFLARVMEKTGRSPSQIVIYGGNTIKERVISKADCDFFGQFPLWLCQYGPKAKLPKAWSRYFLWQYSDKGKIAGMAADGNVDFNVHGGADLAAEWAGAGAPVVVAAPAKPNAVMSAVSTIGASRTIKASGLGLGVIYSTVEGWWNNITSWVLPPADFIPSTIEDTQTTLDQTKQVAGWFGIDMTHVALYVVAAILAFVIICKLFPRPEQTQ